MSEMRVRDLAECLWRLAHQTEEPYTVELCPGGEILLKLDGKNVYDTTVIAEMAEEMGRRTKPKFVTVKLRRETAESFCATLPLVYPRGEHMQEMAKACEEALAP